MNSSVPLASGGRSRLTTDLQRAPSDFEFSAKEATELVGVTVRALRHYQQLGLIPEPRRTSRGLVYDAGHVLRLLRIKRFTTMGLSLEDVSDLMSDPGSSRSTRILLELDQALADRSAEIQAQRRAIREAVEAFAPVDIVPEFARHVAAMRRLDGRQADEAQQALVDLVAGFADETKAEALLDMVKQITHDPLTARMAVLEEHLRGITNAAAESEAAGLAMQYGHLLIDLYDDYLASGANGLVRQRWNSTDELLTALAGTVDNDRQRDVLSRAVTVLATHTERSDA